MFDEKNIYIKQAEVKGCIKQNNNGIYLLSELTVNSSLKNYKKVLNEAFEITETEIRTRNNGKEKKDPHTPKKKKNEKTPVRM